MLQILALLQSRIINLIIILVLAGFALPRTISRPTISKQIGAKSSEGHLVGFRKNRIYLASNGNAFHIEFLNTTGTIPQVISSNGPVVFNNLWPGIKATFEKGPGGLNKSIYSLTPGADPARIRLKYSAPVEIMLDGALRIRLTGGEVIEPAPTAWQLIDGQQVMVSVGLVIWDKCEVGLSVGDYDPRFGLIIDR